MTTTLTPSPKQKFFDNNGVPLNKGQLFVYSGGTTTKATTWQDSAGSVTNTNPIILDYRGECNLWISPNVSYKYVLAPSTDTDPPTNPIYTVDNIVNSQLITLYGGVDTGIANAYVLNFTANFTSLTDGIVIYWIPSHSNTGASTINVNGLGIIAILNSDGTSSTTGLIIANQFLGIMYKGGSWYVIIPPFVQGSFTATITGVTAVTTGTIFYKIANGICTLFTAGSAISGTSNSALLSVTGLPSIVLPSSAFDRMCICDATNNSNLIIAYAQIDKPSASIGISAGVVTGGFVSPGSFTASGSKGIPFDWSITYPL